MSDSFFGKRVRQGGVDGDKVDVVHGHVVAVRVRRLGKEEAAIQEARTVEAVHINLNLGNNIKVRVK